jgi:hypothetical protein
MPLVFKCKCPDCGWTLKWIYDDEEDKFRTDTLTGCPSGGCTAIHEVSAQKVSEEKIPEIKENQDI